MAFNYKLNYLLISQLISCLWCQHCIDEDDNTNLLYMHGYDDVVVVVDDDDHDASDDDNVE